MFAKTIRVLSVNEEKGTMKIAPTRKRIVVSLLAPLATLAGFYFVGLVLEEMENDKIKEVHFPKPQN